METFLEELQLVLPVIGVDFFRRPQTHSATQQPMVEQIRFNLHHSTKGISAHAVEVEGEFVVLAGSTGNLNQAPSFHDKLRIVRDQAFESGRAEKINDKNFRVVQDIAFSSPSAAAMFLFGTSRNGRADWIVEGQSIAYGTWADSKVASSE